MVAEQLLAMDPPSVTLGVRVVILAALAALCAYLFYLAYLHPLADVPGPLLGKFSDLWKLIHMRRSDFSSSLGDLHRKYGVFVRISPNEVSILDNGVVPQLYGHGTKFKKSEVWYGAWARGQVDHFSEIDSTRHAQARKAVAHIYSNNTLLSFEPYVDSCTEKIMSRMNEFADAKTTIDLGQWLNFYAFDVVGELAIGSNFGLLETGQDSTGVLAVLHSHLSTTTIFGQVTSVLPLIHSHVGTKLRAWLAPSSQGSELFRSWVEQQVNARLQNAEFIEQGNERSDMLAMFRRAKDAATGQPFDIARIYRECFTVLGAGSDTTATSLRAFFYWLLQEPASLERLRQEIDEAYENGQLSDPVTYADASKLSYFQACLKEAMRLQPAVGMHLPRLVPEGGAVIANRYFAANTVVGVSPKLIHRSEGAYGKTANSWDPDRWLDGRLSESNKNNLAFGQGARVCIGKNISIMEMCKLLPALIHHFNFHIVNPQRPWVNSEMWFEIQSEFYVTVSKRDV